MKALALAITRYRIAGCKHASLGCQIDDHRKLSVGEDLLDRGGRKHGPWSTSEVMGTVYRCYERDGTVAYQEYACGFQNTPSCDLPKVPYTPEEIDAFSRYKPV